MSLTAKDTPGAYTLVPEGTHIAVCYLLADLGEQPNTFAPGKTSHKVVLGWEIPAETLEDGRPLTISQTYTLSLHEKAKLRHHLEAWRGKAFTAEELDGFDLRGVVGIACQLQVIHREGTDGKTYANIAGIVGMPKGLHSPEPVNAPLIYDQDEPHEETFRALPEWIRKKIENGGGSLGIQEAIQPKGAKDGTPDPDPPF